MASAALGRTEDRGFTIVELMIVLTIVGILAGLALPAFGDFIRNNRRTTTVNDVLSAMMLARAEAAKRGQTVSVCGNTKDGGASCTGGTNWDYGWMAFVDLNGNGAIGDDDVDNDGDADGTDAQLALLRRFVNESSEIKVRSTGAGHFQFRPFNRSSTNATVTLCDKRGASKARAVIVDTTGRARVAEKTGDGNALTCP